MATIGGGWTAVVLIVAIGCAMVAKAEVRRLEFVEQVLADNGRFVDGVLPGGVR